MIKQRTETRCVCGARVLISLKKNTWIVGGHKFENFVTITGIPRPYLASQHNLPKILPPTHHEDCCYPYPRIVFRLFDYTIAQRACFTRCTLDQMISHRGPVESFYFSSLRTECNVCDIFF